MFQNSEKYFKNWKQNFLLWLSYFKNWHKNSIIKIY